MSGNGIRAWRRALLDKRLRDNRKLFHSGRADEMRCAVCGCAVDVHTLEGCETCNLRCHEEKMAKAV